MADDKLMFSDGKSHGPSPVVLRVMHAIQSEAGRTGKLSFEDQQSIAQMLIVNGVIGVKTIVGGDVERARSIVQQVVDAALESTGGDVSVQIVDPGPTPKT